MYLVRVAPLISILISWLLLIPASAFSSEAPYKNIEYKPLEFAISYPEKFRLNNGIEVYFKQDSELPLLDVTISVEAGTVGVPNDKAGLAQLLAEILRTGGAGKWNADQLDQHIEDLAANVSVNASTYTTEFNLSLLSEDAQDGLQLLSTMVRQPRFDEQRFEVGRQQLLESIRRRSDSAGGLAQQLMATRLYAGHSLAAFSRQQSVTKLTLQDLQQEYQQYFTPQNTRIVISGALTVTQAKQWLEDTFGDWHATGQSQTVDPFTPTNPAGILVVDRPLPQTTVLLSEIGIEKNNPDLYAVQVMNFILGGGGFSSRLMREIRSNRGLAYSVYSYFSVGRRLTGSFIAGCETKNSSVAQVVELMQHEMHSIADQPVSDQELQQAKESLINSFVFAFSNSHGLAKRIMRQEMYGYPKDYLDKYRQRIAAVTVADVQRVASKYLHPDQQLIVLVGDKQQLQPSLRKLSVPVEYVGLDTFL